METNNTWFVVPLPKGKHSIVCKWIYRIKHKANGSIERFKACLVVKDYTQQEGLDFIETFSPVAKLLTIKVLLTMVASYHWPLIKLGINNTFLHVIFLKRFIWTYCWVINMEWFHLRGAADVCKLHKSIYGLK